MSVTTPQTTSGTRRAVNQPLATLRTILVATDFSENSTNALNWACKLAQAHSAHIVVVHAIDMTVPVKPEAQIDILKHVGARMGDIQGILEGKRISARTEFEVGKPWELIVNAAKRTNADLIVVGAHAQSTLAERVLGTVADRLIRTTSIPVIVHRQNAQQIDDRSGKSVRTVLAAMDFSEEASRALTAAVRVLRCADSRAKLVLLHSVALIIEYPDTNLPFAMPELLDQSERSAARLLDSLAASLRGPQLEVEIKTFRGYPAQAILDEAERLQPDLIALGTAGRTGLNRFFMGSVATRVLHHARCPVLVARQPDASEPVDLAID